MIASKRHAARYRADLSGMAMHMVLSLLALRACMQLPRVEALVGSKNVSPRVAGLAVVDKGIAGCKPNQPCTACQGDCDADGDCATGLKCFVRSASSHTVPGCAGPYIKSSAHHDYCYLPGETVSPATQPGIFAAMHCQRMVSERTFNIMIEINKS